ncbi:amidohydrolase family protein [Gracilibacillus timonensis]|uniref:amidohydrolase family protein n=1 Tax=Gracilibacillus timonensis TaxID=1816696 RepID=UPI0008256955|nr:amidohydrolase family protein [Gracilibacillus timonensis]
MTVHKVIKTKGLIDGTGAPKKENMAIVIQDHTIIEIGTLTSVHIPDHAEIIDLGDKTVLPGLVDAHMHFFAIPSHELYKMHTESTEYRAIRGAEEAGKMLQAGITAARCLGSNVTPTIRRAINEGLTPGPRMVAAGNFIISTSGTWDDITPAHEFADGKEEVRKRVRQRISQGADVIKIGLSKGALGDLNVSWGDDPYTNLPAYSLEETKVITEEAHFNHVKVSAHCIGEDAVNLAIDGNVDVIEHGYAISQETRMRLVETQIPVVTTMSQLYFHEQAFEPFHYSQQEKELFTKHYQAMKESFCKGLEAGVHFVLGTDLIGYPTHPQDQAAKEWELVVELGMTPEQAIVAGTKLAADVIGLGDKVGTIEKGKYADIIAVEGDPIEDISRLQFVDFVMKDGEVVKKDRGNKRAIYSSDNESQS